MSSVSLTADVEAPLLNPEASLKPSNGDGGAERRVGPEASAGGPLVNRGTDGGAGAGAQVEEAEGSNKQGEKEKEEKEEKKEKKSGSRKRERSVLQAKLTKLSIMIGKVGMAAAVLTVLALFVRFVLDHFVLPEHKSTWNWVYLQYFIKYIVIGMDMRFRAMLLLLARTRLLSSVAISR